MNLHVDQCSICSFRIFQVFVTGCLQETAQERGDDRKDWPDFSVQTTLQAVGEALEDALGAPR